MNSFIREVFAPRPTFTDFRDETRTFDIPEVDPEVREHAMELNDRSNKVMVEIDEVIDEVDNERQLVLQNLGSLTVVEYARA